MLKKYNCTLLHFNKMIKLYIESKVSHKKSGEYRLRNSTTKIDFAANAAKFEETALHKKQSFPLRISSVNVTKSAKKLWNWSHLTKKFLMEKLHFLCSASTIDN